MRREYILLRELNAEGNRPFAEIERKYNFGHGTARYVFEKLKEKGLILRLTLTMNKYNVKYNAIIVTRIVNESIFIKDRERILRYIIKDYDALANRFALVGETLAPFGNMFIVPILREGELETELEWLNMQIGGIKLDSSIVTQIILGGLCYRRLDNRYSKQTQMLVSEYKAEPPKDIPNYFIG